MLQSFLSLLMASPGNDVEQSRRRDSRRETDRCICAIQGRTYPIENWSFGGILLMADERMFGAGQQIDMTLKFKLHNRILDIAIKGQVVRKTSGRVGVQFEPLNQTVRRHFHQVIEDNVSSEFADSQVPG